MGDDDGFDSSDVGGLLFGYLLYRELHSGRLDAGGCLRAGCLVAILIGAVLGGLLLLAALATSSQRYAVDPDPRRTHAAYIAPRLPNAPVVLGSPLEPGPRWLDLTL